MQLLCITARSQSESSVVSETAGSQNCKLAVQENSVHCLEMCVILETTLTYHSS